MPDALWHLAGWAIALLGAPLLARALLADRAKGRRRCPKCWYSMEGVPASPPDAAHPSAKPTYLCPECGHTARTEKSLLKTRRRLKLLPLTLVAILAGYSVWTIPRMQREGAKGLIPTTYLILAVPYPETDFLAPQTQRHEKLQSMLRARAHDPTYQRPPQLYAWQNYLWDWSLRYRFALDHRPALPSTARDTLAKLDGTTVDLPQRLYLADLVTLVQNATGLAVECTEDGELLLEVDAGSTSAAIALDKACASLHNQTRWSITEQGVIITPSSEAPSTVLGCYPVADILDLRQIGQPSKPNSSVGPVWIDNSGDLANALVVLVDPDDWIHNGGKHNYAAIAGSRLFVVADPVVQLRVAQLINALQTAKAKGTAQISSPLRPADLDPIGRPASSIMIHRTELLRNSVSLRHVSNPIVRSIEPDCWYENGGNEAFLMKVGDLLIVEAPARIHPLVVDRLAQLKEVGR